MLSRSIQQCGASCGLALCEGLRGVLAPARSYLINASRGQVVDLASLAEAVKSGRVAGAAVDVYPTEPETNSDGFLTGVHLRVLCLCIVPAG